MEKVRFGKTKAGHRKNTLVTVRVNDDIYFGISRCRISGSNTDKFDKDEGLKLARLRASNAIDNSKCEFDADKGLSLHRSGMFGRVDISSVKSLINYFKTIK